MSQSTEYLPEEKGFFTKAIHSSQTDPNRWDSMCVVPPIVQATAFKYKNPREYTYIYGRAGNPSRQVLEGCIATLEDAKHVLCFGSGLGALTALISTFSQGDHFISCDDMYSGNFNILEDAGRKFGMEFTPVDATNVDNVKRAIKPNTKLIFIESPTNPLLKVMDIRAIAEVAKKNNAILCVDNTFLTPFYQKPLELGADVSLYSLTKYMNGHNDVTMGALVTNNEELHKELRILQTRLGIVPAPIDCSLVTRSLKTLPLRMQQHFSSSLSVAKYLESHPKVLKVLHPGLESHPQHELTKRQTSGHSGMMSIYLDGGLPEAEKFATSLKIFTLANSLGGYQSLVAVPTLMTHSSLSAERRKELKITDNLIRLSIGLEDLEDLIADLAQALDSF